MSEPPKHSASPIAHWTRGSLASDATPQQQQQEQQRMTTTTTTRPFSTTTTTGAPASRGGAEGSESVSSAGGGVTRRAYMDAYRSTLPTTSSSNSGVGGGEFASPAAVPPPRETSVTYRPAAAASSNSGGSNMPFSVQSPLKRPSTTLLFTSSSTSASAPPPSMMSNINNNRASSSAFGEPLPHPSSSSSTSSRIQNQQSSTQGDGRPSFSNATGRSTTSFANPVSASTHSAPPPAGGSSSSAYYSSGRSASTDVYADDTPAAGFDTPSLANPRASLSAGGSMFTSHSPPPPTSNGNSVAATDVSSSGLRAVDGVAFTADLLFLWLGVERTKFFRYHVHNCRYEFIHPNEGSVRQRRTLEQLEECGILAHEIETALRRSFATTTSTDNSSSGSSSFLQQSLRSAVREQMTQYHYFVSSLRERVDQLTVADLVVSHKKILPKLSALVMVLSETSGVKGGELVSRMQSLIQQGSSRLNSFLNDVYLETITPLLQMAAEWIIKGEVADPFQEFFVKINPSVDIASDSFWSSRFGLELAMLPTTVSREVAESILAVGRNIVLITKCSRAKQWRMDARIAHEAQSVTFQTLPKLVEEALEFTNRGVMQLVMEQLHMMDVLNVVQQFLLVGHGEFFEGLIRRLDPLMQKPASSVQASVVADHVQLALLEVTTQNAYKKLNSEIVLQLESEVIKVDKAIGWDCFALVLPLPSPLNNIIDTEAKRAYRRLFKMMFLVKRAEVALKLVWRQSVMLDRLMVRAQGTHDEAEMAVWRKVAGDAHLLSLQLNHFVTNLWSYFVSEVSTTAWDKMTRAVGQCKSFDDLREVHTVYVQQLSLFTLLHTDCREVRDHIVDILSLTRDVSVAQGQLTNLLERGLGNVITISSEYQRIADRFEQRMTELLRLLEEQHMQFDFLNFLLLRLNFNNYYRDSSATVGGGSGGGGEPNSEF